LIIVVHHEGLYFEPFLVVLIVRFFV